MSVADKNREEEKTMPVRDLPMPPVKVQSQDASGGSAFVRAQHGPKQPVPQLVLNFAH